MQDREYAVTLREMKFTNSPIEDMEAPTLEQLVFLVDLIQSELELQNKVIVHCAAGLGRTGTVAACVLIRNGYNADGAISMIRYCRPGAIESMEQEKIIHEFSRCYGVNEDSL
ncbi:MAG: dual specificity protein phosphatase family protein, partial [Candidatus Peregrinibacteria bacterium]|nr:dual specificity protein phosphatase family protein [Candidatus Peregrinibacteria bacterium]